MEKQLVKDKVDISFLFNNTSIDIVIRELQMLQNMEFEELDIDGVCENWVSVDTIDFDYDLNNMIAIGQRPETEIEYEERLKREERSQRAKEGAKKGKIRREQERINSIEAFAKKYKISFEAADQITKAIKS